jgi:translation initiation factor 2 subunit 2
MAEEEGALGADEQELLEAEFALKKKKKPKKKKATDTEGEIAKGEGGTEGDTVTDKKTEGGNDAGENNENKNINIFECDPPNYEYTLLLNRVVDAIHSNNPELADKKRFTMKPPQLMRVGTKKTLWANFPEICAMMRRSPDHVFQFMIAELGTEGSIDGNKRLVIKGKFVPKVRFLFDLSLSSLCYLLFPFSFYSSSLVHRISFTKIYCRVCFLSDVSKF